MTEIQKDLSLIMVYAKICENMRKFEEYTSSHEKTKQNHPLQVTIHIFLFYITTTKATTKAITKKLTTIVFKCILLNKMECVDHNRGCGISFVSWIGNQ